VLSVIIPVYKNEESIEQLLLELEILYKNLNEDVFFVFVVDGSPDRSFVLLKEKLNSQIFSSELILLSRNFGSFSAIRTGIESVQSDFYAVMAADLQEPIELVVDFYHALKNENVDVVIGTRSSRNDPFFSSLSSKIFWFLYKKYVVTEMPIGGVDVFGCTKKFRNSLLSLPERHSSLVAQIFWLGYQKKIISYVRSKRQNGKSAWTLHKKINYLMDSVFSFTDLPIRLLMKIGGFSSLIMGMIGFLIILSKITHDISVPGYAMIMLTILFVGSVNIFSLGIVGSYAWRAYENTKKRPHSLVISVDKFEGVK
jgi:glycosyltransferase involved in cell wall biosynthesis